jgi:hypothetical protein
MKKWLLKWIRTALRQKRIEVPDCNGAVRWSRAHSFFPIGQNDQEEGSGQEISDEISPLPEEEAPMGESF